MNPLIKTAPRHLGSSGEQPSTASPTPHHRPPKGAEWGAARVTHRFQPSTCHRCHAVTLHGIDVGGNTIDLDPTPLDVTTEAQQLIAGNSTWQMTPNLEVIWRSKTRIMSKPAGNTVDYAVFAKHRCDQPVPTTISNWAWQKAKPQPVTSEEPGF